MSNKAPYEASSVMNTAVISVGPHATLEEVVKILADNRISGLPVVDSDNKVIGVITETDIVNFATKVHVIPLIGTSGWLSPYIDVTEIAKFKKGFNLLANTKVEKVMSKRPVTVSAGTYINKVAELMKKRDINRVFVIDKEGKIIGVIARADLVDYLAEWKR
ncbi:MAG: CBS domain-containing protein [Firmicutes bacterium]|nr:CBS domain-containing protein [Bacillota bacterium]